MPREPVSFLLGGVQVSSASPLSLSEDRFPILLPAFPKGGGGAPRRSPNERFVCEWRPWQGFEDRRYGVYSLSFDEALGYADLVLEVLPSAVLTAVEYNKMVKELSDWLPNSLWETQEGSNVRMRVDMSRLRVRSRDAFESFVQDCGRGLESVRRIVRNPRGEVAPLPPRPSDVPGRPRVDRDIPENQIALIWCRQCMVELDAWLLDARASSADLQAEVEGGRRIDGGLPEWTDELLREARWLADKMDLLRGVRNELNILIRALKSFCSSGRVSIGPAVRRNGDSSRIFQLLPGSGASPNPSGGQGLSLLSVRRASFLFEAWAAGMVAQLLEDAGLQLISKQSEGLNLSNIRLERQVIWRFRDEARGLFVEWGYGPRAVEMGGPEWDNAHLSPLERAVHNARRLGVRRAFVTGHKAATPDYYLRVETLEKVAWVVGDAKFSDPQHNAVLEKVNDVRRYSQRIGWLDDHARLVTSREYGSFVLVPDDPHKWLSSPKNRDIANQGVLLLGLRPNSPSLTAQASMTLGRLLDTLQWAIEEY